MPAAFTIGAVGHYCGRFNEGLFGEPLNELTNLAFLAGAGFAWYVWNKDPDNDSAQPLLFFLAATIGIGSLLFHAHPTTSTLVLDLVPVQVFTLTFLGYVCVKYLRLSILMSLALVFALYLLRRNFIAVVPKGAWGGGITHVPALVALFAVGLTLAARHFVLGRYVLLACIAYAVALVVRAYDLRLCARFPLGIHWVWHLLTALTVTLLVYGAARCQPARR